MRLQCDPTPWAIVDDGKTLEIHVNPTSAQCHADGRRAGLKIRFSQKGQFSNEACRRCRQTFERRPSGGEPASYGPLRQAVGIREYAISVGSRISLIEPQLQFAAWQVSLSVKCANRF